MTILLNLASRTEKGKDDHTLISIEEAEATLNIRNSMCRVLYSLSLLVTLLVVMFD